MKIKLSTVFIIILVAAAILVIMILIYTAVRDLLSPAPVLVR